MKKYIALLLLSSLLICGCSGHTQEFQDTEFDKSTSSLNITEETDAQVTEYLSIVSVNETVLYDGDGIKLTLIGMEETYSGIDFKVLAENNTDNDIAISCDDIIVNGITMYGDLYISIAAGKKANDEISFSYSNLEFSGIEEICYVETKECKIVETTEYNTIGRFSFRFETTSDYVQNIDSQGNILYDEGGIRIISKGWAQSNIGDIVTGEGIVLLIQNKTETDILVQADNASVNGFMFYPLMSDTIYSGTSCFSFIEVSTHVMEDNNIETIEDISVVLKIMENQTFNRITETNEITIKK